MTETYGFFNSGTGDTRTYQSSDFADFFANFFGNGVWSDILDELEVTGNGGLMQTIVADGKALVKGHWYINDTYLDVVHSAAHATLDRIDRVVLQLDLDAGNRWLKVAVLEGTPASSPAAPTLTQTSSLYEISLAQVLIEAASTIIETADVTDERPFVAFSTRGIDDVTSVSADYTIDGSDSVVLVTASTVDITITLPPAADVEGRKFDIKKIDATTYAVIIDGNGSETIDGAANYGIGNQYESITVVSNGTNWYCI